MPGLDYDALWLEELNKKNESNYADSTELRPEESNTENKKEEQIEDEQQKVIENDRLRDANKVIESVAQNPESVTEQITELKKQKPVAKSSRVKSETCHIKDFSRKLMREVRHLFPDATNNADALMAFVVTHLGKDISISESVDKLVSDFNKDDPIVSVNERLRHLEQRTTAIANGMSEMELACCYIIFDRLGYRNVQPKDARSTDMLESNRTGSVVDIITRLREQTAQFKKQENIKEGRLIR